MKVIALLVLVSFTFMTTGCYKTVPTKDTLHAANKDPQKVAARWKVEQNGFLCKQIYEEDNGTFSAGFKEPITCPCHDLDWADLLTPERDWKGNIVETKRLACRNKDTTEHYTLKYSHGVLQPSLAQSFVGPLAQGLLGFAGLVFLGTQIRAGLQNQPAVSPISGNTLRVSTLNTNGPIPGVVP